MYLRSINGLIIFSFYRMLCKPDHMHFVFVYFSRCTILIVIIIITIVLIFTKKPFLTEFIEIMYNQKLMLTNLVLSNCFIRLVFNKLIVIPIRDHPQVLC